MAPRRSPGEEPAHDVLAAEAFAMPAADPRLHVEPAHDVLAAEAFAMPAADPALHQYGPVRLPDDPTGIAEAHDVLAAEEFAMPAAAPSHGDSRAITVTGAGSTGAGSARRGLAGAAALSAYLVLRARRRR